MTALASTAIEEMRPAPSVLIGRTAKARAKGLGDLFSTSITAAPGTAQQLWTASPPGTRTVVTTAGAPTTIS